MQKVAAALVKALEFERIYFDFQKQEYQLAEEYLSGDIWAKIEAAPPYEPQNEIEKKILA